MTDIASRFEDLDARIARRERASLFRTILASLAVVAVAAAFLWFTLGELRDASERLAAAREALSAARQELGAVEGRLAAAQTEVAGAQFEAAAAADARDAALAAQRAAEASAAALKTEVATLQQQVADLQDALEEALNLERHIYELDFADLKSMYAVDEQAANLFGIIADLRDEVRWSIRNADGGYNSPGFAALVLSRFRSQDVTLDRLERAAGKPRLGDIVTYDSGYALFYFRDLARKEFVIGMTPFGVLALNYDFGVKRGAVLRTGVSQR